MKVSSWEYRSIPFPPNFFKEDVETVDFEQRLNSFGKEGWELVSIFTATYRWGDEDDDRTVIAVFKRPL